jgi:hypothetical protein
MDNYLILSDLNELENRRKRIIAYSIASRLVMMLTMVLFFTLFFGFIESFMGTENDFFFKIFKAFFYFVPGIILFMLIFNLLEGFLKLGDNITIGRKVKFFIVLGLTILSIILAGILGKAWLGTELDGMLFLKWFGSIFILLILGLLSYVLGKPEKVFTEDFKNLVIPKIVESLPGNAVYHAKGMIKKELFLSSELFPAQNIHSYTGNYLIEGNYGKGEYQFSQLEVKEKRESRSSGSTSTSVNDLFKGLFYAADFNKHFKGITVVLPDHPRKLFGAFLGEQINALPKFGNTSIVRLENPDFEKEFAVYSNDQVEARYILSPALMDRMLNLQKRLKQDFYVSFFDNKMFLAVYSQYDVYAPFLFKPVNTEDQVKPIVELISGLIETAKELDLNTRIWSKE